MPTNRIHDIIVCDGTWEIVVFYHQLDNDPKFPYQVQIHLLKDIEGTTSGVQHIDHYKTELSALMDGCDYVSKHQHGKE